MNKHISFQKFSIVSISAAALGLSALSAIGPTNSADAAPVTNARGGTFTLTFNGQTTAGYGKDGAKGGNVEFEWRVEEGESAPKTPGLTSGDDTSKGGNIEFEWKVEEGES